jgi:hypothetical protein
VATMIQRRDQNSASCGSAFPSRPGPTQRPKAVFRELGFVVTVEPKWSLEGEWAIAAVFCLRVLACRAGGCELFTDR